MNTVVPVEASPPVAAFVVATAHLVYEAVILAGEFREGNYCEPTNYF
jgi:hypothetical protein